MNIVAITDIHGHIEFLRAVGDALKEADLVIVTGDITHFGRQEETENVIKTVTRYCSRILAVPGNCDYPEVGAFLAAEGLSLDARAVEIDGILIAGVGGSLPCPGRTPNENTEDDFAAVLSGMKNRVLPRTPDIFVSHQPPWNTRCDLVQGNSHVGSRSIRRFIEETKPALCLSGHIHESSGMDRINDTVVANPGPLFSGGYTKIRCEEQGITAEIIRG